MIYILEDDDNIRKLVSYALSKEGYDVADFALPSQFFKAVQENIPSLIMLDIMLPEQDGLSILKKLKQNEKTADIPVIMLTAKGSEFDKATGLDMGADDYISKPFGIIELVARVGAVLRRSGRGKNNESIYSLGPLYVDAQKHIITVNGDEVTLSFKEYMLLLTLLQAQGRVVSRDALLAKVWGEFYEESRTLDVHIRKLRLKLGAAGSKIKTVKNMGYKIEVE